MTTGQIGSYLHHLKAEHVQLDWLVYPRVALFSCGALFSMAVACRLLPAVNPATRISATIAFATAPALIGVVWYRVFFIW